jgi:hypothetical protein
LESEKLKLVLEKVVSSVPINWCEIKVTYYTDQQVSKVVNQYRDTLEGCWEKFNYSNFDTLYLFEDFKSAVHDNEKEIWTSVALIFNKKGNMEVKYGFEEIDIITL